MKLEDVQKCPECHNEFMQPFTCTTCGAQKLYDATLATAEKRLALAVAALKELSCLGNGDQPGNSTGNRIAQETLAQIEEKK